MSLLSVRDVTVRFGGLTAISGVDIAVAEGSVVGLVGPNGAGKTTLFNVVTGIYKPTSGRVDFGAKNITGWSPNRLANAGIARTFQNLGLFAGLTVEENVLIGRHIQIRYSPGGAVFRPFRAARIDKDHRRRVSEILSFVGLSKYANSRVRDLPYGLQKITELARALAVEPRLLLLDEPAAGLGTSAIGNLIEQIRRVRAELGISVLIVEHNMEVISSVCDTMCVLNSGSKLMEGKPEKVLRDPRVIDAYLGRGGDHA